MNNDNIEEAQDNKPPFDPNAEYTPVATETVGEKPAFNPDQPYKKVQSNADIHQKYYEATQQKPLNKKIVNTWSDKPPVEEEGVGTMVMRNLNAGSAWLEKSIANAPAQVYDLVAAPFNYVMSGKLKDNLLAVPQIGNNKTLQEANYRPEDQLSSKNFRNTIEQSVGPDSQINTLLKAKDALTDSLDKIQEDVNQKTAEQYGTSVSENFANGDYEKGFKLMATSVANSLPVTASLMLGNAAGLTATQSTLIGGAVFGAAKKAELDQTHPDMPEDQKILVSTLNGLSEGYIESSFGITTLGKEIGTIFAREGVEAGTRLAAKGFKDVYLPVLKKYAGNFSEEVASEMVTQYTQNAIDKYVGGDENKNLFEGVVDAGFVAMGMSGPIVGAVGTMDLAKTAKEEKIGKNIVAKDQERNEHAYEVANNGDEAIRTFKEDIGKEVTAGNLSPQEAADAIARVNAYKEYKDITGALDLTPEKELEVFDKSYRKQQIEKELEAMGDPKKLNGPALGLYQAKEKLAADIQKDITEIVTNAEVKKATTVGKKTVEDIAKKEQKEVYAKKKPKAGEKPKVVIRPELQALIDKNKKKISNVPEDDGRSYDQVSVDEFNRGSKTLDARQKHNKMVAKLKTLPGGMIVGKVAERYFSYAGKTDKVLGVEMPDGKIIRFSSSMKRDEGFRGHFREEQMSGLTDKDFAGVPMAMKVVDVPAMDGTAKSAIKAFNTKTGKFVGWMKATNTGQKKQYSDQQVQYLMDREMDIEPPIDNSGPVTSAPQPVINPPVNNAPQGNINTQQPITNEQQENTSGSEKEPTTASVTPTPAKSEEKGEGKQNAVSLRNGVRRANQNVKGENRLRALELDVFTPYDLAMQFFIGKGFVSTESFRTLYEGKPGAKKLDEEIRGRNYILSKEKGGQSIEDIAHKLWENNKDRNNGQDTDYVEAINDIIQKFNYKGEMADSLIQSHEEGGNFAEMNAMLGYNPLEQAMNDELEKVPAEDQEEVGEMINELEELSDDELIEMAKSQESFDEFHDSIRATGQLNQKRSADKTKDAFKVIERLKAAVPKINWVYDNKLTTAGRVAGNTVYINPYYAGYDTPIHEVAHIMIETMGDNAVLKKAVDQLRDTSLWKEVADNNPELSGKSLENEVLAEAIGREGAGIFDTESKKSDFKVFMEYIFDWIKRNLGMDKNIAKSLAKQIIGGSFTKNLSGVSEAYNQNKNKKFNSFRESIGRDVAQIDSDLQAIDEALSDPDIDDDTKEELEAVKEGILDEMEEDRTAFKEAKKELKAMEKLAEQEALDGYTIEELTEIYNQAKNYEGFADKELLDAVRLKIGDFMTRQGVERLRKNSKFVEETVNQKDMTWRDVWFKVLSNVTEKFPALQELSTMFEEKYLAKIQETNQRKHKLEKLGKAVIKETNRGLGVVSDFFRSDNAKYFNFVEEGGKLRTNTAGLTKAQKDYLAYFTELLEERNAGVMNSTDQEIIKIDKGTQETFRTEGLLAAINVYLGGNSNIDTEVEYTNPTSGKSEKSTYYEAQKELITYGKKGPKEFAKAMWGLLKLAYQAKKSATSNSIKYNGRLTSKFDKPRPQDKDFSRDFYKAASQFIDDAAHVKYMNDLVPIVDSIELFYKTLGFEPGKKFDNVLKFLEEWKSEQIYQKQKTTDPALDLTLGTLRSLTSKMVMGFNVPANVMNVFIGNYNVWRQESLKLWLKGQQRLFIGSRGSLKSFAVSKKAMDIINKFDVVAVDYDSNPKAHIGKLFDGIAFAGGRWGEFQIQGSMFLGQLTTEEMNAFTYDKDGELTINQKSLDKMGITEKEFNEKMTEYKTKVSDVQGKYALKDRMNFMRFEAGRSASQFKIWMGGAMKSRFGEEFINKNGETIRGSWTEFKGAAFKELKEDFMKRGPIAVWDNKNAMANLKGAMTVAFFVIAAANNDDEDKRRKTLTLENALSQLMMIFTPSQMKYLLQNQMAGIGTVVKFIEALEAAWDDKDDQFQKKATKLLPYNKLISGPMETVDAITDEE